MLVLSRTIEDSVILTPNNNYDQSTIIKVISIRAGNGRFVKIGIDAPDHIKVLRDEIFFRITDDEAAKTLMKRRICGV